MSYRYRNRVQERSGACKTLSVGTAVSSILVHSSRQYGRHSPRTVAPHYLRYHVVIFGCCDPILGCAAAGLDRGDICWCDAPRRSHNRVLHSPLSRPVCRIHPLMLGVLASSNSAVHLHRPSSRRHVPALWLGRTGPVAQLLLWRR